MAAASSMPQSAEIIFRHIQCSLKHYKLGLEGGEKIAGPLMVGLSAPQGSGKTTLSNALVDLFRKNTLLNVVIASLDDFYLSREQLEQNSIQYPTVPQLHQRGLPGTHDIELMLDALNCLGQQQPVLLPRYDKSLLRGRGDRLPQSMWFRPPPPPYDVVVVEGWMLGFDALEEADLVKLHLGTTGLAVANGVDGGSFMDESISSLLVINRQLLTYRPIHDLFRAFISLSPRQYHPTVHRWRLQQEHQLIATTGSGMTDSEVEEFLRRFWICYELYGTKLVARNVASNDFLQITLADDRSVNAVRLRSREFSIG